RHALGSPGRSDGFRRRPAAGRHFLGLWNTDFGRGFRRRRRPGRVFNRQRNLRGARLFGDTDDPHGVAEDYLRIAVENDQLERRRGERLFDGIGQLSLADRLLIDVDLMVRGIGHGDAVRLILRRRGEPGQINVGGGFDRHRRRHHKDDQQDQEDIGERRDVDGGEDTALIAALYRHYYALTPFRPLRFSRLAARRATAVAGRCRAF